MGSSDSRVAEYITEARFIRAFAYVNSWTCQCAIGNPDFFGLPEQSNRQEIFSFVEQKLLELESLLPASEAMNTGALIK